MDAWRSISWIGRVLVHAIYVNKLCAGTVLQIVGWCGHGALVAMGALSCVGVFSFFAASSDELTLSLRKLIAGKQKMSAIY
jgi:hypothetical protein